MEPQQIENLGADGASHQSRRQGMFGLVLALL